MARSRLLAFGGPRTLLALDDRGPDVRARRRRAPIERASNLRNTDGRRTQLAGADSRIIDYHRHPWVQRVEKGWDKPDDTAAPKDVLDLFK
jgi:hypothetical protein